MSRKALMTALLAALCLTAVPVLAAPLQKNEVSPTANWVAHVDLEAFRSSGIGKLVLAELQNQGIEQKLQSFAAIFSFHPLQDIRDVTLYGKGRDRSNAVALVDGRFDSQKLLALVRLNPQYQEIPYKGTTLHRWPQEEKKNGQSAGGPANQMMYGCICDGDRVVLGTGLEAVQQAVDTIQGQAAGTSSALLDQIPQGQGKVFAQVVASGVGQIVGEDPKAALLKQTDALTLTIGETADQVFGELNLQGQSAEMAGNMTELLQGLIAWAQMMGNEQPQLAELAKKLSVSRTDKTTQVRFGAPAQTLFEFLKEQWAQQRQKQSRQPAAVP